MLKESDKIILFFRFHPSHGLFRVLVHGPGDEVGNMIAPVYLFLQGHNLILYGLEKG